MARRLATVAAMMLLWACAGVPGTASAMFTGVETITTTTAATSAYKTATATCPAGKRVTGTGFDVSPPDGRVLVDYVRPNASLTSVSVRADEDEAGTAAAWTLTAYAICAPAPAGLQRVVATSASSSAAKSVAAACPAGTRVLGTGGELAGASRQLLLNRLTPNAHLTTVTVRAFEDETGTARSWTVTAYAICARPAQGVRLKTRTSPSNPGNPQSFTMPCDQGEVPVGLGAAINGTGNQLVLQGMHPGIGGRLPGMTAAKDRTGFDRAWSVSPHAICGAEVFRAWQRGSNQGAATRTTNVGCGTGQQAVGGGAETDGGRGEVWFDSFGPEWSLDSASVTWHTETAAEADVTAFTLCATTIPDIEPVATGAPERPDDPVKTATTACPAGKRVLGGSSLVFGADTHAMSQAVVPSADLVSLRAGGAETEGGLAGEWFQTAMAVCAPPPPGLQRVARTTGSDSSEYKITTATCPAGKHLVGTGAEVSPAVGEVIVDDIRPNQALTAVVAEAVEDRTGFEGNWRLSAYAVCVSR